MTFIFIIFQVSLKWNCSKGNKHSSAKSETCISEQIDKSKSTAQGIQRINGRHEFRRGEICRWFLDWQLLSWKLTATKLFRSITFTVLISKWARNKNKLSHFSNFFINKTKRWSSYWLSNHQKESINKDVVHIIRKYHIEADWNLLFG